MPYYPPLFNITNETYYPIINQGETKTSFCLRECFNEIGTEVMKAINFDGYTLGLLISLAIAGGVFRYYLFKKLDKKLVEKYSNYNEIPIEIKVMKFFITMVWFVSCVLLAIILKFRLGFIGFSSV